MRPRTLAAVVALCGLAGGMTGCGGGTPTVSEKTLESTISTQLEETVGQRPDRVDCPDGLVGKVGTTQRCTLHAGTDTIGVEAEVTSVDGKDVSFDIQVDDQVQ